MGKFSDYKKYDEIANNDLNKGCRHIVNQSRPAMRRLKAVLRRASRKRYDKKSLEGEST